MRGKPPAAAISIKGIRITPADAGKTCKRGGADCGSQDHPRGCGENSRHHLCVHMMMGSPPRMRGKRARIEVEAYSHRITPADAGKTLTIFRCKRRI